MRFVFSGKNFIQYMMLDAQLHKPETRIKKPKSRIENPELKGGE